MKKEIDQPKTETEEAVMVPLYQSGKQKNSVNASAMLIMIIGTLSLAALGSTNLFFHGRHEKYGIMEDGHGISLRAQGSNDRKSAPEAPQVHQSIGSLIPSRSETESQRRSLNIREQSRWKDRSNGRVIIPVAFSSSISSSDEHKVWQALGELEEKTGCVNFEKRQRESSFIFVENDRNSGCMSWVGKQGGQQILNLASGCVDKGVIQHEFMHALGFHHEQARPDRDSYVNILYGNIKDYERVVNNFDKAEDTTTLGSPYDYGSIMHYESFAFALPDTSTITSKKPGMSFGQRDGASDLDIKKIKLLYQCERGNTRTWASLENSPCTSDCKCRRGDTGCGTNDDACHGSLVCSSNKCTDPTNPPPAPAPSPTPAPPPTSSSASYIIWRDEANTEVDYCMDLYQRDTSNHNKVWYFECNFTPAQYWYIDSNGYIRTILDRNKCLVGAGGYTELGTELMIYDCLSNDSRFLWDRYPDGSIRPRNNNGVCIEQQQDTDGRSGVELMLDSCIDGYKEWNFYPATNSGRRLHNSIDSNEKEIGSHESLPPSVVNGPQSSGRSLEISDRPIDFGHGENCTNTPPGWYDFMGRNCQWYNEDVSRCEIYGGSYKNFGVTAIEACCACGGGSTAPISDESGYVASASLENETGCWNAPDFYDSTGDGCDWYEQGDGTNCEYFGWQFTNEHGQNANSACCTCGGGLQERPSESDFLSQSSDAPPGCSNSVFDWINSNGDDCSWYASDSHCEKYGDDVGLGGKMAKDVCCVCGGGLVADVQQEPSLNGGRSDPKAFGWFKNLDVKIFGAIGVVLLLLSVLVIRRYCPVWPCKKRPVIKDQVVDSFFGVELSKY